MNYIVADPTKNITVLITDNVPQEGRKAVVEQAFEKEPTCEQVGFVSRIGEDVIKLDMMGGEFCGNATISAAAYLAQQNGLDAGKDAAITVDASGTDEPVRVAIRCIEPGKYIGTLEMTMPELEYYDYSVGEQTEGLPLVKLDGISHLILDGLDLYRDEMEQSIRGLCDEIAVPALGMLKYTEREDGVAIEPLVYVEGSGTLVWENGCASGSLASAYYKHIKDGDSVVAVKQPGGVIRIEFKDERVFLTGGVQL